MTKPDVKVKPRLPVIIDVTQETQEIQTDIETHETHREPSPPHASHADGVVDDGVSAIDEVRQARVERATWFAEQAQRPLGAYVVECYYFWRDREDDGWTSNLFHFVWMLRGHPDLKAFLQAPGRALSAIEHLIRGWSTGAKHRGDQPPFGLTGDCWRDWFDVERHDARAEFADVWMKSRFLPGQSPLQQAFDEARRVRLLVPDSLRDCRALGPSKERSEKDYEFFLSLAGHLQVVVGANPIKLPCETIGDLLGVSKMTISRYRRWAVADRFLVETRPFKFRSKGRGDATEFQFDVSQYSTLSEKAAG